MDNSWSNYVHTQLEYIIHCSLYTIPHCNTPNHTTIHCSTLQYTATHCNTLQHIATQCNTLQHTATQCNTLQPTASHCNTLQHTATHCNTLQHTPRQWDCAYTLVCLLCVWARARARVCERVCNYVSLCVRACVCVWFWHVCLCLRCFLPGVWQTHYFLNLKIHLSNKLRKIHSTERLFCIFSICLTCFGLVCDRQIMCMCVCVRVCVSFCLIYDSLSV